MNNKTKTLLNATKNFYKNDVNYNEYLYMNGHIIY